MECGAMHFGEFNPLDVLATAASLQSVGRGEGQGHEQSDGEAEADEGSEDDTGAESELPTDNHETVFPKPSTSKPEKDSEFLCPKEPASKGAQSKKIIIPQSRSGMPRVVKVVSKNGNSKLVNGDGRPVVSLKDTAKVMVTGRDGTAKTLTVLRINKSQNPDHSYAVYTKVDKSKGVEEDEGYCSRSSLGSPGQGWKSDSEATELDVFDSRENDLDPKSPNVMVSPGLGEKVIESPTIMTGQSALKSPTGSRSLSVMSPPSPGVGVSLVEKSSTDHQAKVNGTSKKPTKIVIVSRDANLRKFFEGNGDSTKEIGEDYPSSVETGRDEFGAVDSIPKNDSKSPISREMNGPPSKSVSTVISLVAPGLENLREPNNDDCSTLAPEREPISDCRLDNGQVGLESCMDCNQSCEQIEEVIGNEQMLNETIEDQFEYSVSNCCTESVNSITGISPVDKDISSSECVDQNSAIDSSPCDDEIKTVADVVVAPVDCKESETSDTNIGRSEKVTSLNVPSDTQQGMISLIQTNSKSEVTPNKEKTDGDKTISQADDNEDITNVVTSAKDTSERQLPSLGTTCGVSSSTTSSSQSAFNSAHGIENNEQGEQSVIHPKPAVIRTTVLPPGEQPKQQPSASHRVLQGLLAAGNVKSVELRNPTRTVLLPTGQIGMSNNTSVSKSTDSKVTLAPGTGKQGIVYLVSSNQGVRGTSLMNAVTDKSTITISSLSNQSNQYIIQDDVPPVANIGGSLTKSASSPALARIQDASGATRLCAVQPKTTGHKDNWIALKPGIGRVSSNSLLNMTPNVQGVVSGSCAMVPLLIGGSSMSSRSLLSLGSKGVLPLIPNSSSLCVSPMIKTPTSVSSVGASSSPSTSSEPIVTLTTSSTSTTTIAIPKTTSSLLSSHSLLPSYSPASLPADTLSPSSSHSDVENLQEQSGPQTFEASLGLLTGQDNPNDFSTPQKDSDPETPENKFVGYMTPLTPTSGRTTPAYEGRMTPLGFNSSSATSDASPSPGGKINIKISGGVVVDVRQENNPKDTPCKAMRSIGQVGSLTWHSMPCLTPQPSLPQARSLTSTPLSSKIGRHNFKKSKNIAEAVRLELKRKQRAKMRAINPSRADLFRMKETAQNMSELHPLIDHDYCMFTEFTADIQSSIIATTESKLKTERKYVKKSKAARTKTIIEGSPEELAEREEPKLKKRKYTKRKLSQLLDPASMDDSVLESQCEESPPPNKLLIPVPVQAKEKLYDRKPKRRYRPRNSGDKNYVKIPGSYQDDFVYYATKKLRGRPRKFDEEWVDMHAPIQKPKPTPAANMSEFEWYKEMACIDKGTKFGVAGVGRQLTSLNVPDHTNGVNYDKGITSIHESEVVDMVMDMMPPTGLEVTPTMDPNKMFGPLITDTDQNMGGFQGVASEVQLGSVAASDDSNSSVIQAAQNSEAPIQSNPEESTVDASVMAEFHRLLNSMEESDQLKILENLNASETSIDGNGVKNQDGKGSNENNDGIIKEDGDGTLNNLNAYLGSYENTPSTAPLSHTAPSSQFLDLDEINDSDLLNTSELGNINAIFGDLATTSTTSVTESSVGTTIAGGASPTKMVTTDFNTFTETSYGLNAATPNRENTFGIGKPLDRAELFPDISAPVAPPTEFGGVPELTLVNMYWNDLPGLVINGQEFVRLVDIHKQVLPAKDTGILKKRCQMMKLEIRFCSELHRDFLIRYMNAAKSKSCVIVPKETAKTLIGFYVDPRPRTVSKQTSEESTSALRDDEGIVHETVQRVRTVSEVNVCDEDHESVASEDTCDSLRKPSSETRSIDTISPSVEKVVIKTVKQRTVQPPKSLDVSPAVISQEDVKRSARLKNKKVQYASLHSEGWLEEGEVTLEEENVKPCKPRPNKVLDTIEDLDSDSSTISYSPKSLSRESSNSRISTKDTEQALPLAPGLSPRPLKHPSVDDLELRRLVNKQKKRKLNPKEKRAMRRLRERLRKARARYNMNESKRLEERRGKWIKNLEKAKLKRLEKKAIAEKYSQEHCYAAYPEKAQNEQNMPEVKAESVEKVTEMGEVDTSATDTSSESSEAAAAQATMASTDNSDPQEPTTDPGQNSETKPPKDLIKLVDVKPISPHEIVKLTDAKPGLEPEPAKSPDPKLRNHSEEAKVHEPKPRSRREPKPKVQKPEETNATLQVVHMDSVQRGQRSRTEEGTLHLARYVTREAACIECNVCHEFLSIRRFLKHRHHLNKPDELVEVSLPQRLELCASAYSDTAPPVEELKLWDKFGQKRQDFATNPARPRRDRRSRPNIDNTKHAELSNGHSALKDKGLNKTETIRDKLGNEKKTGGSIKPTNKHTPCSDMSVPPLSSPELKSTSNHAGSSGRNGATPEGTVRHSSRERKRKQLHPMETFIFSQSTIQGRNESTNPAKRRRISREQGMG